jgi:hypothetical protein
MHSRSVRFAVVVILFARARDCHSVRPSRPLYGELFSNDSSARTRSTTSRLENGFVT